MKRIIREMSRGNSIIASVVLIGILGTLSIALQATTPQTDSIASVSMRSQVAKVPTVTAKSKPISIPCYEGVEYKVTTDKGKAKTSCVPMGECTINDLGNKDIYTKAGAESCFDTLETIKTKQYQASVVTASGQICKVLPGETCKLQHCFKVKNGEKCVNVVGNFRAGEGFAPANNEAFAMRELVRQAAGTGDEASSAAEALRALKADPSTSGVIDNAFKDVLEEQKGTVIAARACDAKRETCLDEEGIGSEQSKLQKMQKLNDDLKKVASIDPTKNPDTKTPPFSPDPKGPGGGGGGADKTGGGGGGGQKPPTTGFGQPSGSGAQQKPASSGAATSNPYQQCYPQYFCTNNTLYWGSPQSQQQSSYYPYYGSGCQNQVVQYCQYGCVQGGTACSQNPQNTGQMPVATLSCGGNNVLDVGASVPITFSCTNATASAGSGFSTGGALSGSASTTIQKPPAGANTVSYGLTCTASNNQTASARCDVGINVTSIVIVANPKQVASNASTTIGWVTKGMKECVIQADNVSDNAALDSFNTDNASNTAVSGVATTPGLVADTTFTLSCKTQAGQNKNAAVTVKVN